MTGEEASASPEYVPKSAKAPLFDRGGGKNMLQNM